MTEAMCLYEGYVAGKLTADQLFDSETTYKFMPARSKAHMDLGLALIAKGKANVKVEWEGRRVPMIATAMEVRSITLRRR